MATYKSSRSTIRKVGSTSGRAVTDRDDDQWENGTARHVIDDYDSSAHKSKKNKVSAVDLLADMRENGYENPELSPLTDSMSNRLDDLNAEHEQQRYQQYLLQQAINPTVDSKYDLATAQEIQNNAYGQLDKNLKTSLTNLNSEVQIADEDSGLQNLLPWNLAKNIKKAINARKDEEQAVKDEYGLNSYDLNALKTVNARVSKNAADEKVREQTKKQYNLPDDYYDKKDTDESRNYLQEIEYANNYLSEMSDDPDALRKDVTSYLEARTAAEEAQAGASAEAMSGNTTAQDQADYLSYSAEQKMKVLKAKYKIGDTQYFNKLAQYVQELNDYDERQAQQQEAYDNVHTGSVGKNIAGGVVNTANALASNLISGMGGVLETVEYAGRGSKGNRYADTNSPLNANSQAMNYANATSDYQGQTQQALSDWNKAAGFVYGAGMSALESVETNLLGPTGAGIAGSLGAGAKGVRIAQNIASLAPFAMNAYSSSLSEGLTSGKSMDDAMASALVSAGVETGTEVFSVDKFWDTIKNSNRTARKVMIDFLASSVIEGSEEAIGDIADLIIDEIRYGDDSDYNNAVKYYISKNMSEEDAKDQARKDWLWQLAEDAAAGALSGAMGGAISVGTGSLQAQASANEQFGNYTKEQYQQFANDINVNENDYVNKSAADSAKRAKELAEKYSTQDTVTDKERRELYYAYNDSIDAEAESREKEAAKAEKKAKKDAAEHRSWQEHESKVDAYNEERGVETNEQTTEQSINEAIPQDLRAEVNDSTAGEVHKDMAQAKSRDALDSAIQKGLNSTDENTRKQTLSNLDNLAPMLEANGVATESEIQALKQTDAQIYQAGYTGEEIETATTRQKQIYNAGQQDAIKARSASNLEQRELITQNAASIKNEDGRKLYTDAYQTGMNAQSFDRIVNTIMAAGRNGMSLDNAMDKVGADLATVGGDEQALRSSLEGLYSHAQQQAKNDAVTEAAKALRMRSGVQRFGTGTVTDKRKDQSVALPEMRMIEAFAQMTGVDYYIADEDYEIDGKRIFDGETQGYYSPSDSTIYLNVNERGQLAGTSIHEGFVEFASVWAGEETVAVTKALHTALIDSLGTSKYNNLLRAYRNAYAGETSKTDADLDKEILADMAPVLLSNKESLTKFVDTIDKNSTPKEARTIKEKLANWLSGLADALRDFLSEFKPTKYQQQVAEAQIQNIEELRDMLIAATARAVQNYQQARMAALAETLGINENPATVVENVTTAEDAYQIAYDNFANTVNDIASAGYDGKVDNDVAQTFIDVSRAFKQSVANDEAKARDVENIIDVCRNDLFTDEQQNRRVGIKIDGYTPVYDGIGTHSIPHSDTIELGEYRSHGERPIDAYVSIGKLTGAINAYEQKYGISDDTVRGYLDDAKKAVNGIQEAMDNGYAAEDGSRNGVISAEGEYFKTALKDLKKYALEHVDGFKDSDINNKSTAASLRNINTWQGNREQLGAEQIVDEAELEMLFGKEKNRYAVPYVRNSKKINGPVEIFEMSANDFNKNIHRVHKMESQGTVEFLDYSEVTGKDAHTRNMILDYTKQWGPFYSDYLGRIDEIAGSSAKDILRHGEPESKFAIVSCIKTVLEKGVPVAADVDHKGPNTYNTVTLVAPVTFTGTGYKGDEAGVYYAAVIVRRKFSDRGVNQRVHVIDIFTEKKGTPRTVPAELSGRSEAKSPSFIDILKAVNDDVNLYNEDDTKYRFSRVIKDSNDAPLTEGQQEYFKDSKAVDDDGRLKVMYHGTSYGGFTVFNTAYAYYGFFFTDDKDIARSYSGSDTPYAPTVTSNEDISRLKNKNASVYYQTYLNLKNPLEVNADGNNWKALRRQDTQFRKDMKEIADIIESKTGTDGYDYIVPNIQMSFADAIMDELYGHEDEFDQKDINRIREIADRWDNIAGVDGRFISYDGWDESYNGLDRDDIKNYMQNGYIPMNSNDYAIYAQQNGYDGVIFKNMVDPGPENDWLNLPSNIMVAFNSNQVKSINNENPTDDVDIRKSMKIDDNRNMNNEEISANRDEVAAALEKGKEVLKGTKVNKMAARNIAMEMKRDYGSAYDLEQFTNNLTKLFGYLHSGKSINYNDFVAVMQDVARPVVDAAYTSQASREDYAQFRNGINELSFSLTSEQTKAIKSAFGSMKAFERYYPEIHITEDGKSFAEQWSSLVDLSRGLLDENTDAVDMPTALVDAMEALRPSMNNWEDNTQAAHDMALDIISKYLANYHDDGANKAVINEFVKSAEKEIKASQKEWKTKIKEDYKERLKAERAYQKEIASNRVARANERSAEQIAKLRAKNATRIGDIRERQKRNHQLQQINKSASKLYQYLTNPTDQNHVPKDLQEPVMQLMASLDMSQPSVRQSEDGKWHTKILAGRTLDEATGRYTYEWKEITADSREDAIRQYNEALADGLGSSGARKWYDRMRDIADMYNKKSGDKAFDESNSQDMMDFLQGLSEDLAEEFDNILKDAAESGKASIAALGSDELKTINKVLANVLQAVNMINKSYSVPSATISEMSEAVIAKANTVKGRRNHRLPVEQAINFFTLSNANMHTFFHAIGADTAIDIIINAQNQKAFILKEAQETSRELLKGFTAKELENMEKDSTEYLNGKVKLTTFQRMDLREILMRPDAASHFAAGIKQGALPGWTNTESVARHLTMDEAWEIVNTLDERYRNLSDGMQQFMARMGSTYGNRTSNLIHGYDKFTDDRYITMQTDSTTHRANTSELLGGVSNSIKNMGMTKAVTGNATNALVINNLSDVYAKHIADMAVYSAWAPAIQDLIRFYNYKQVIQNEDGTVDYITTKDAIRKMFGDAGNRYFVKMISDLQHAEQSSFEDPGIISFFTGNAKKAATMANMRVVVQQPTAIMRAGKRIDYKYLNNGITGINGELEKLREDMIGSDAVYWIKQQGNIDGQITQSLKSQITGIQGWREKVDDKTGWLAGKADQVTWDAMYRACIAEQIDKMGRDKIGTQEFKDAVNYKFDHLMLETQVYDGTITRSQFMRSADKYAGQLSAFMAEPTKTYNIVLSDMIDYMQTGDSEAGRRVAKAALGTTAKVLVITAVANAAAQSFADAFRNAGDPDDEDDLNFIQRFWSAMGWDYDAETWQDQAYALLHGNLADNLYLWNNIPIINDLASSIDATLSKMLFDKSSYSSSDSLESQWLTHLDDWMSATQDLFADKETKDNSTKTKYSYFAKTARLVSDLTGIPVYAAQRDLVAAYNTVIARGISGGSLPVLQNTKTSNKARAKKDIYNIVREGGSYDEIKAAIDEAIETSNSYDGIKQGIKTALKDEFIALYKSDKSAAGQMKTRIAQIYVYIADKEGTYKDKTDSEKLEMYKKQIDKWLE